MYKKYLKITLILSCIFALNYDLIGSLSIDECIRPRVTATNSDDEVVSDCVTTCNMHLVRLSYDRQATQAPVAVTSGWQDYLWELAGSGIRAISPVAKAEDLTSFRYAVFSEKVKSLAGAEKTLWCKDMVEKIEEHSTKVSYSISKKFKGCLESLSLYKGCHAKCTEILRQSCQ